MRGALSALEAAVCCGAVTALYVGLLYLFGAHRIGGKQGSRYDDLKLIRHRLWIASIATVLSVAASARIIAATSCAADHWPYNCAARRLGLPAGAGSHRGRPWDAQDVLSSAIATAILPLALTATVYAAPLLALCWDRRLPFQASFQWHRDAWAKFTRLQGLRNFVVGPITEELVFRSCIVGLSQAAGHGRSFLIFATPCYFSIAHFHHAWEYYVAEGRTATALRSALIRAAFQMLYTAVFGWYANFLFLRTGGIVAPCLCHVFCNVMGLPLPSADNARTSRQMLVLRVLTIAGAVTFGVMLFPMTEPSYFKGHGLW